MGESGDYCWAVLCKNHRYHKRDNLFFGHQILLGETDSVSSQPMSFALAIRCDECGKEYVYSPGEVFRVELEHAVHFTPHPLFR